MKLLALALVAALIPLSSNGQSPITSNYSTGPVEGRSVYEVTVTKDGEVSGWVTISGGKAIPDSGKPAKRLGDLARQDLTTLTYFYKTPEVSIVAEFGAPRKIIEELVNICLRAHVSKISINANYPPGWPGWQKILPKLGPAKQDEAGTPEDKEK